MTGLLRSVKRRWRQTVSTYITPTTGVITVKYETWRRNFLWQRLRLWSWLALLCLISFVIRDIYNFFSPLREFADIPKQLTQHTLLLNGAMLLSIIITILLHRTRFGRRHPGVLFLGLSWSISLGQQIFSTLKGFALPDILTWSLLFLGQATFMPVRWTLHLMSQMVLLIYYFGVNFALGFKVITPNNPEPIYNVTFLLYVFWLCAICNLGVYLYDRLQSREFQARKELEITNTKLKIAEAKYRSIFENAVEGIFQSTPEGRYITANPALARIFGFTTPEEIIDYFTDISSQLYVNPQRRTDFIHLIEEYGSISEFESQIYRRNSTEYNYEGEYRHIVWISEKAYAVRDRKGDILYYEGTIEDITKRKRAEEALQEQFDFLQVLIDTIPAPVYYQNAQGLYVGCNKSFETALGLKKAIIIGSTTSEIIPKELADKYHQADMSLFQKPGVQTYESSMLYADGKQHDVIFYKATYAKVDGTLGGLVGVILDISDRKRTEEALRVFFHAVSHDLRNPVLGTLMVLRNLLHGGIDNASPQSPIPVSRFILERMLQSGERQLNLINSLMEAHVSEIEGISLQLQPVNLYQVAEDAIADLQPTLTQNEATLTNQIKVDLPAVKGDSFQLWRVFSNLIGNSLKHNPPGLTITVDAKIDGGMICCTVADNGVGMTEQQCERLFDLYFRGTSVRSSLSLGLGLGLGLYLCRQIITAHGGEVSVKSSPNAGATFSFTLPVNGSVVP
ncbi:PAS domain-containing sensor histidine kinase [Brunnivagina elsteri]|uniref:histidine kinase n=1 Tax=Brunnivagina elsteri CCALA 953 TaxID=987040 RepID=A0A2A2TFX4_9CYAN|nr:PAS domain-containing sensor histidine kinase [Calothrix elsteri]PAX52640.1 PAS domain-containing sensor histidine kinase [Calothrix elsteri CCALA 953]